jgi:hypothetical protein
MTQGDSRSALFVGALLGSLVGVLLLIFTDFGGWYNYNYYAGFREWGYIGISSPISLLGVIFFALPFIYCSFVSLKGAQNPNSLSPQTVALAYRVSIIGVALIIIAAVVFVVAVSGADDWWFDAGFYGSMIGGLLTVIMLRMAKAQYGTVPATTMPFGQTVQPLFHQGQQQSINPGVAQTGGQIPYFPQSYQQYPAQAPPTPPAQQAGSVRFCLICGAPVEQGMRFCQRCGAPIQ